MVEFSGDDPARGRRPRRAVAAAAGKASPGLTAAVPALDPAVRDPLWDLRRPAMPLLYGMPGDRKPVTFVEDTAVSPERLPEFVARFRETAAAATAPTAPSTATPASAVCTFGRC